MTETRIRSAWRAMLAMLLPAMLMLMGAMPATAELQPGADAPKHLAMRLVADIAAPHAGSTVTLAIDTRPQAGWHGYWVNPGDAGFPARFDWTLSRGMTAGTPQWPVPTTLVIAGLMNHVYERPYAPLIALRVPAGVAAGTALPVRLAIDYLVCSATICVPERQDLSIDLSVGDGAPSADAGAFDAWRRAIPKPLDAQATYAATDGRVTIAVPFPAGAAASDVHFFPLTEGALTYAAAQTVTRAGDVLTIATAGKPAGAIEGVLKIGAAQGLTLRAVPGTVAAADTPADAGGWSVAIVALLGAIAGGLVLNVMPCVFPILSLKALGLVRSGAGEREARHEAVAYTAGVVAVCVGLGAAILLLRAGGSAVGWAFQLTDPRMIVLLTLLSVSIALNLAGLFEMPMPRFAGTTGTGGAFATGALAAFVATPCTGPFMAAALGTALVLPWYAALCVFAGLGLGLALPFLLIGFVPALRRRLPKPGAWMERFRHALSVPMWLTAIALLWVLGQRAGVGGMTLVLIGSLGIALVLWVAGGRQRRGRSFGWGWSIVLVAIAALASGMVAQLPPPAAAAAPAGAEPFTEARLAALRQERRPVFVYFTADWCLTCKVNEKAAIETDATRAAFAKHKVAVLVGDWTDGDASMGRFIQAHNRAGVPLYLYYPPGAAAPDVLPQVLTPSILTKLGV